MSQNNNLQKSRIIGTGSCLPEKVLTNFDLEKIVETSNDWIIERTGICSRRVASSDEAASDIALTASRKALESAGVKPEELDLILVGTFTGDAPFPTVGNILQARLGAVNAVGFDISATCSGFLYVLSIVDAYVKSGRYKKILAVGVDVLSKFMDWTDRGTCILFGDGAGAAVIEPSNNDSGIIDVTIGSDGTLGDMLYLPGGGSRIPASRESVENGEHFLKMNGNEVFKVAVKTMERISLEILEQNNIDPSDVSIMIPHQANVRIIQAVAKRLDMSMDKVYINLDKYGNTSAGTIPIAIDEAAREGRLKEGDIILMAAFGGGLTWGSAIYRW
jgi:3-oxoacyl-[acyl-carrier-protein] synthase-3